MSDFMINPNSAYLCIKMNGKLYDLDINFLKSMNFSRATDTVGKLDFVIEDTMDLSIEEQLMSLILSKEELSFQYGWYQGPHSPWYCGYVSDYKPTFHANFAMTLTVSCVIMGRPAEEHVRHFKANSPDEIVKQICAKEGWPLVDCDPCDPFTETREFDQANVRSLDFIKEKIEPEATCGGTPMQFYLDNTADGQKAYFVKIDKYAGSVSAAYTFMINAGNMGNVISFDPSFNATATASAAQQAGLLDQETNELHLLDGRVGQEGTRQLVIYGATSPDRMKSMVANKWYGKNIGSYPATITVYGDPTLQPMRYIKVLPFRPDGTVHHTEGIYLINNVTDNIEMGVYTTTMALTKVSPSGGDSVDFGSVVNEMAVK